MAQKRIKMVRQIFWVTGYGFSMMTEHKGFWIMERPFLVPRRPLVFNRRALSGSL